MQMLGMMINNRSSQPEYVKDDSGLIMSNTASNMGVGRGVGYTLPGIGQANVMPGDQPQIPNLPMPAGMQAPQTRRGGFSTGNILTALLGSNFGRK